MSRRVLPLVVLLAVVAAGTSSAASRVPGYLGCSSLFPEQHPKPLVRPSGFLIACGDGNFSLRDLRWTTWSANGAHATGTGWQNDCKPYCAAGHFHAYPAAAWLSRPRTCMSGALVFTRLTWRYTRTKPPGIVGHGVENYPC